MPTPAPDAPPPNPQPGRSLRTDEVRPKDPATTTGQAAAKPTEPPTTADPTDPNSTIFLVGKAQARPDEQTWELLSAKISAFLGKRFQRKLPSGVEFGDFVSDVMVKVLSGLARFQNREGSTFWGWIHTLANHALIDNVRRHRRDAQLGLLGVGADPNETQILGDEPGNRPGEGSATQEIRAKELEAAERDCVSRLGREMRTVYTMRRVEELPFAEISVRLGGTNEGTLRSTYSRARDYVCSCVAKKVDDAGRRWNGWRGSE